MCTRKYIQRERESKRASEIMVPILSFYEYGNATKLENTCLWHLYFPIFKYMAIDKYFPNMKYNQHRNI